jgi:hypothetical protein
MKLNKIHNNYCGLIAHLAFLNQAKNIVEIGVNQGDTTLALCEAAKQRGGTVYGFDLWGQHGLFEQFKQSGDMKKVENRLKEKNYNNFKLYKKNTFDSDFPKFLKEKVKGSIDLAFIDGCHSYTGCLNDLQAVYPLLSKTGVVVFHDTQRIDGCREIVYDLRTKYYDGTYDIFDLGGGYGDRMMGISFLIKRQFPALKIPINQLCGSPSSALEIEKREKEWYDNEIQNSKNNQNLMEINPHTIKNSSIKNKNFRPQRKYLS